MWHYAFSSMRNSNASIVLALSLDLMMAPQVENRLSTVAEEAGNINVYFGRIPIK